MAQWAGRTARRSSWHSLDFWPKWLRATPGVLFRLEVRTYLLQLPEASGRNADSWDLPEVWTLQTLSRNLSFMLGPRVTLRFAAQGLAIDAATVRVESWEQ